jgi:phosphohistidine phosphatase
MTKRTLYIMRHAAAIGHAGGLSDFDRVLSMQGMGEAIQMGERMATRGIHFDAILSAKTPRCIETANLVAEAFRFPQSDIVTEEAIYNASDEQLLAVLHRLPASAKSVLLIGHYPSISDVVSFLSHHAFNGLPTGGVVSLEMEIESWATLTQGAARFGWFDFPHVY